MLTIRWTEHSAIGRFGGRVIVVESWYLFGFVLVYRRDRAV